jgi:uncharacterized protein (TIGR00251 family)
VIVLSCIRFDANRVYLDIKAFPAAPRTEFAGVRDGRLRVRIAKAPEDGRANAELIAFLARTLRCPRRVIGLAAGEKSRLKTLSFPAELRETLETVIKE